MNNHVGKASTPINLRALDLIRDAFDSSSLTQEELAKGSGVPRSTLANMLSRTGEPRLVSIDWFARLAETLGVDAGDWMDELERVARECGVHRPTEVKLVASTRSTPRAGTRRRSDNVRPK